MGFIIAMLFFGLIVGAIGKYLYGVVVGAKQAWNEKVVPAAKQAGLKVTAGAHGFSQLISEQPDGNATVFVNNGVAAEPSVAQHLRSFNTNGWLTVVTKPYPSGSGPSFTADGGAVPALWSTRAKELMLRSGGRFAVVSGGQRITIVTAGVVEAPVEITDMLELAHELARA